MASVVGHRVPRQLFKNTEQFDKYRCLVCKCLLRDAVQAANCGHWFCEACIALLIKTASDPACPGCDEPLKEEDGDESEPYYPDKFVRRDIDALEMMCPYHDSGCTWEGTFGKLSAHLEDCEYSICQQCKEHLLVVPAEHTCTSLDSLEEHQKIHQNDALNNTLLLRLTALESTIASLTKPQTAPVASTRRAPPLVEADGYPMIMAKGGKSGPDSGLGSDYFSSGDVEKDHIVRRPGTGVLDGGGNLLLGGGAMMTAGRQGAMQDEAVTKLRHDVMTLQRELREKNEEIVSLRAMVNKLEKVQRSKTADFEDRDFRLSLIENSNHDGTMVWKIPQFSQRMDDAKSGKYTSIFSLPFYTGRYGYKMCLRLYILGDGIGKGSYMSLFFVLMKGEFDNILQWPFTHKVTFKLINQSTGRDVVDTFQPDPMSSSFRKPKSDMNIASGCPRFISHSDLKNGFTIDDTVFIKCIVDTTTIKHP